MEPGRGGAVTHNSAARPDAAVHLVERNDLTGLRAAWDDLVDASPLPSPFLKSWWVENAASGTPLFLVVMDATGELVGGFALELDRVGPRRGGATRVRGVGQLDLAPDHLDVVGTPQRRTEVLAEIARWFRSRDLLVDLDGLNADCELPWLLGAPVISTEVAPYLPLSRSDPLAHLPGRLRSTIKRSGRRLAKQGFTTRRVIPQETPAALQRLLDLHDARWDDDSALGPDRVPLMRALTAGATSGEVVVHELTDGATVVASEVELIAGTRVSFYQSGRLTDNAFRGSGSVLKADVVRWATEAGYREFDLLRGNEPYKDDWSLATRTVQRVRVGFGPVGSASATCMNLWKRAAPHLRRLTDRGPRA